MVLDSGIEGWMVDGGTDFGKAKLAVNNYNVKRKKLQWSSKGSHNFIIFEKRVLM